MNALHLMGPAPYYTNSYVLISDKGNAIVVDPAADLAKYQQVLEQEKAKLVYILLTHGHFDHTYTVDKLQQATGAKIIAARGT